MSYELTEEQKDTTKVFKVFTITGEWDCKSDKTEIYNLLNMVHSMAGQLAQNKNSMWKLKSTATHRDYVMTSWTNGIVDIVAETYKNYEGDPVLHRYTQKEATQYE